MPKSMNFYIQFKSTYFSHIKIIMNNNFPPSQ